ncbi:YSIRK-type signal peptide-containing protein, partial [Lactobacillus sp.]|uniref:YSIRK-type signal peptide-containing protein n=1 Tax=Lactobacillus sp. TaxID=1591 RepID=UPI003F0696D8
MSHKHDPYFNAKLNGKEKFGFRKLSLGLAAVALGTSFFVSNGQLVHAADDQATETVVQQSSASDSSSADTSSSTAAAENTSSETATAAAEETTTAENAAAESTSNESTVTDTATAENTSSESTREETATAAAEQKQADVTSNQTASTETADKETAEPAKESAAAAESSIPENEASTSQNNTEAQESKQSNVNYNITVYDSAENAKSANPAGKIESSPDKPENLTPGNQNIYLRFNISGLAENTTPLTISFDNAGGLRNSSKDFVISYNAGTTTLLEQSKPVWNLINNGDGTLTLSRAENTNATSADFYIPVQANRAINPSLSDEGKDSSLTPVITTSDGTAVSSTTSGPVLYAKITPAKDFVQSDEILYGFSMEERSLTDEMRYNPGASDGDSTDISLEHELDLLKANSDGDVKQFIDSAVANNTVYQWGYYFNYPKTSLENADFRSYFDKMQIPLYSTLKVFAVPDDLVSYTNSAGQTVRIGEDQKLSELPEDIQAHY